MDSREHNYSIILFRAISCCCIFLGHFLDQYQVANHNLLLNNLTWLGNVGITSFAFISGYSLAINYNVNNDQFLWFKKRLLRIFPPLWIFLIFALFFARFFLGLNDFKEDYLLSFFGMNGLIIIGPMRQDFLFAVHTWFITFILFAYLLFPYIYQIFGNNSLPIKNKVFFLCLVYLLCCMLDFYVGSGPYAFFPCIPCFFSGVFYSKNISLKKLNKFNIFIFGVFFIVVVVGNNYFFSVKQLLSYCEIGYLVKSITLPLYPILLYPVITSCASHTQSLFRSAVVFISAYSYEIYLYHLYTMRDAYRAIISNSSSIIIALFYSVIVTLILSVLAKKLSRRMDYYFSQRIKKVIGF